MTAPGHAEWCDCAECGGTSAEVEPPIDFAMMDDPAPVAHVEPDPWLERRSHGFGASEIATLFVALGMRDAATVPKYMQANAKKLLRVKAGLARPNKVGAAAREGSRSERALVAKWAADAECPVRSMLASVTHADAAPKSFWPLVDRHCPRLSCTPDGWGSDLMGADVLLEAKCTASPIVEPHWYWRTQVQAALAVSACEWGAVIIGEWWAAPWREPGEVSAFVVERDDAAIAEIRAAVVDGWQRVEALRGAAKAAGGSHVE